MRIIRTVIVGLLAACSAWALSPPRRPGPGRTGPVDRALPKRTITEVAPADHQINYNTFLLKGTITELQVDGDHLPALRRAKVQLQRKVCGKKGLHVEDDQQVQDQGRPASTGSKIKALESGRSK